MPVYPEYFRSKLFNKTVARYTMNCSGIGGMLFLSFFSIVAMEKNPYVFNISSTVTNHNNSCSSSGIETQKSVTTKGESSSSNFPPRLTSNLDVLYGFQTTQAKIIGFLVCGSYISMIVFLYALAYKCDHCCPWAHWKQELSIRQLRKMSSDNMIQELSEVVFENIYEQEQQQDNMVMQIVYFINDIDKEIACHKRFLSLHAWVDYFLIFPKQETAQIRIAAQYERLKLIRSLLITSLSSSTQETS